MKKFWQQLAGLYLDLIAYTSCNEKYISFLTFARDDDYVSELQTFTNIQQNPYP